MVILLGLGIGNVVSISHVVILAFIIISDVVVYIRFPHPPPHPSRPVGFHFIQVVPSQYDQYCSHCHHGA